MKRSSSPKATTKETFFADKQWQICIEHYLLSIYDHSRSKKGLGVYRRMLRRFFSDPRKNPNEYTRGDVENFIHAKTQDKKRAEPTPRTRNGRLAVLCSFYKYAAQYYISFRGTSRPILRIPDPTRGIKTSKVARVRRTFTDDQLRRLFAAIPRDTLLGLRDRALFLTYFWTARRRSEIARLRWRDLEIDHVFSDGHVGVLYRWSGKGRAGGEESAELPAPAWEAIKEYLIKSGRWGAMQPDWGVFIAHDGRIQRANEPISDMTSYDRIRHYLKEAGIAKGSPHWLRHTAATKRFLNDPTKNILEIQKLLKHANLNTTWGYLQDAIQEADTAAARLFDQYGNL